MKKDIKIVSKETRLRMSLAKKGKVSPKKGSKDISRNCIKCNKIFSFPQHENKKYCERKCMESKSPERYCELCKNKIPHSKTTSDVYYKKMRFCSPHCRGIWNAKDRKGIPVSGRGNKHWAWKGGRGTERHRLMSQQEYAIWRNSVFKRDNYTCQICGIKDIRLNADHIKSWAKYPKLRYDINNGRTLCYKCHYEITFGKKIPQGIIWG